jgi:hypothetical protein
MSEAFKQIIRKYSDTRTDIDLATPVNQKESAAKKRERIKLLEANPEDWIKYYFPNYAKAAPAPFHIAATKRVLNNPEWYEVRCWSRELAKSTRTMMEVFYLTLVGGAAGNMLTEIYSFNTKKEAVLTATEYPSGHVNRFKKKNVLLISNSFDNAERLLMPYMANLTKNNRIIKDYGVQRQVGRWTSSEFITRNGVAFRAVGAGQSPRGSRNEDVRPDIILFDDLDTDADCLNPDIIHRRWNWVEQAVIPARSVSEPLLVIWCGNIIADDCCVARAQKFADHTDIINIRDENGNSTWPQKNSEDDIDRVLSKISYAAQQKEYYNNPMNTGRTFTEIVWGTCPPIKDLAMIAVYGDPATSDKDLPGQKSGLTNSRKAIFVVGKKGEKYYIYTGYLDVMSQDQFIRCFYETRTYIAGQCQAYYVIECNSLQDPFYTQVILPRNNKYGETHGGALSLLKDTRKKGEKWFRIEAELEPINRDGNLIFNVEEKNNPHMERLAAQFLAASATSKQLDGPDCIEGAKFFLNSRQPVIPNIETADRFTSKRF